MVFLYISHPVKAPRIIPPTMLAQLMAFVVASIFSPLLAITASLDPMNTWIKSFGVAIAVARAYVSGCTVGTVDIAPFESEYGSGQSRIMQRSFRPSCFRTRERAAKRGSFATRRLTKPERIVRDTRNEQKEPMMVAAATMNHL